MSKPYRVCPKCGCNLDHGERCDCEDRVERLPLPGMQRENTKGGAGP